MAIPSHILVFTVVLATSFLADGQGFNESEIEAIRLAESEYISAFTGDFDGNSGRVELRINGTWGTVCDHNWNYFDARVACRMLGHADALCGTSGSFFDIILPPRLGEAWMDNVTCTGEENVLDQCSFEGWGVPRCSLYESAYAVCLKNEIFTSEVPSKVKLLESTTISLTVGWTAPRWFSKQPDSINSGLEFYHEIRYESEDGTVRTARKSSSLVAPGAELNYTIALLERDKEYKIEIRSRVSHLLCYFGYSYAGEEHQIHNFSDPVYFKTQAIRKPTNVTLRLVSPLPGVDFMGRVEVFHNNEWGTICDDRFYYYDARVVCGVLNYTRGSVCYSGRAAFGRGQGRIWLTNLTCSQTSEVIEDCNPTFLGAHNNQSCTHSDDVGVVCIQNEGYPLVQNFRVVDVGPTSATFRWNQYTFPSYTIGQRFRLRAISTNVQNYFSRYRTLSPGTLTEYTLFGLTLGEQYNVTITPLVAFEQCPYGSYSGEDSNVVVVVTRERAPTGAPQEFQVDAINTTAIEVQWELPPIYTFGGVILGYKLFVQPANGEERVINIQDNETNVYTVGELEPATPYSFSILAYNTIGDGPRTTTLTISTLRFNPMITQFGYYGDGLYKATRYISFYQYGRVHVYCSTSGDTLGEWYFSNGTRIGTRDRNFRAGHFSNGTAVLQIADTRPLSYCDGGTYTCRVVNDTTLHYETRNFTLVINRAPPTPGKPYILKDKSTSITIGWYESYCDGGHTLDSFIIRYSEQSSGASRFVRNVDPTLRNYTVTGLLTDTFYSFQIQVLSVDSRYSPYSAQLSATTLSPAPSPPREVTVRLVTPVVAEVRWRVPATFYQNIVHYNVYAIPVVESLGTVSSRKRRQSDETSTPNTIHTVFPQSARAGNVTITQHSLTYQFRVSATATIYELPNEGELSANTFNTQVFVPEPGLPSPLNARVTQSTNASVSLTWDYPPPPSHPIQAFLVTYSGHVEWRSPKGVLLIFEDSGEVSTSDNEIKVTSLTSGTTYQFRVYAVTQSGTGAGTDVVGQTEVSNDGLAYFQVRLEPIVDCIKVLNSSEEQLFSIRSGLVEELAHICPSCGLTITNIKDDEFSCRGGLVKQIVYRGRIAGTDVYSAPDLVTRMQSWIASGSASIMVQSSRLHLDPTCDTSLDTLRDPDCPIGTDVPEIPSTSTKPSVSTSSVVVGKKVGAGEIIGVVIGAVIIILLAIPIVLLALVLLNRSKQNGFKQQKLVNSTSIDFDNGKGDEKNTDL